MRKLTLNKETVAELTPGELTAVVGADAATVAALCTRPIPTVRITCGSEVDACVTAQICS